MSFAQIKLEQMSSAHITFAHMEFAQGHFLDQTNDGRVVSLVQTSSIFVSCQKIIQVLSVHELINATMFIKSISRRIAREKMDLLNAFPATELER
jgi:hypothetical protein